MRIEGVQLNISKSGKKGKKSKITVDKKLIIHGAKMSKGTREVNVNKVRKCELLNLKKASNRAIFESINEVKM